MVDATNASAEPAKKDTRRERYSRTEQLARSLWLGRFNWHGDVLRVL
jgi:hypothetical protein